MACEYTSTTVFERFADQETLKKALGRVAKKDRRGQFWFLQNGGVEAANPADMNALKQAYQVEAARAALKKKGFFVTEKKTENGKITLTVRA